MFECVIVRFEHLRRYQAYVRGVVYGLELIHIRPYFRFMYPTPILKNTDDPPILAIQLYRVSQLGAAIHSQDISPNDYFINSWLEHASLSDFELTPNRHVRRVYAA